MWYRKPIAGRDMIPVRGRIRNHDFARNADYVEWHRVSRGRQDFFVLPAFSCSRSSLLTNWTRAHAGSLFHKAVEIGHLLI